MEERDCLMGLAPKYDAKETARQAALEALQQHRYLDAADCANVYAALCRGVEVANPATFVVVWSRADRDVRVPIHSRKNADRLAAHVGGIVRPWRSIP